MSKLDQFFVHIGQGGPRTCQFPASLSILSDMPSAVRTPPSHTPATIASPISPFPYTCSHLYGSSESTYSHVIRYSKNFGACVANSRRFNNTQAKNHGKVRRIGSPRLPQIHNACLLLSIRTCYFKQDNHATTPPMFSP